MIFPAGQRIRFTGRDAERRATALSEELRGRCKVREEFPREVELLVEVEMCPRQPKMFFPVPAEAAPENLRVESRETANGGGDRRHGAARTSKTGAEVLGGSSAPANRRTL